MLIESIGWIGAILILLAYWLLTHKVTHSHSYLYQGLNLVGGLTLVFEAWAKNSYPVILLNVVWVMVAIYGLLWAHKRKDPRKRN